MALSCLLPSYQLAATHVVTIEGLNLYEPPGALNLVQRYFKAHEAVQCGFCTPGFIMAITSGLLREGEVTYESLLNSAAGNICRCTGYGAIRRALFDLSAHHGAELSRLSGPLRVARLIELGALPAYFADMATKLAQTAARHAAAAPTGRGDFSAALAGGTDLMVGEKRVDDRLFAFGEDSHMCQIQQQNSEYVIGRGVKVEQLFIPPSPLAGLFAPSAAAKLFASEPIRRQATVAGNLANASPIGDLSIMLLALDARLTIEGSGGSRQLPLKEFFLSYRQTALKKCETIEKIHLSAGVLAAKFNFEKVSTRRFLDIATVNSALALHEDADGTISSACLTAGGVAPVPLILTRSSAHMLHKKPDEQLLLQLCDIATQEIAPISDVRGSAEYKTLLVKRLLLAHFITLFPEKISVWEKLL
jgi:xanthine dehydrogenase small subunit